jgi:hypothetical protein
MRAHVHVQACKVLSSELKVLAARRGSKLGCEEKKNWAVNNSCHLNTTTDYTGAVTAVECCFNSSATQGSPLAQCLGGHQACCVPRT